MMKTGALGYKTIYVNLPPPPTSSTQFLIWRGDNLYLILHQEANRDKFLKVLEAIFLSVSFTYKFIKEDFAVVNDWGETLAEGSDNELVIYLTEISNTMDGPI